jgi:endoglucanase
MSPSQHCSAGSWFLRVEGNAVRRIAVSLLVAVAMTAVATPVNAASSWTAEEAVARLGRGVNLGNALEAPNFEGEWGMVIEDEFFQLIAGAGFDSVRLPIRWDTRAMSTSPWTIDPGFMARIDELVRLALDAGLAIIIDFHHFEDLYTDPAGNTDRFVAIWRQIVEHFESAPPEVFFELQNEPHGNLSTEAWNTIFPAALDAVRQTNPDRMVIVGGGFWNSAWELANLDLPDDPNLIGTFHMYEPFQFTHQGAEWVDGSDAWLGTTWEGRTEDTDPIVEVMDVAAEWADATGIPLLMGEFGSYEKADIASRVRFTEFVRTEAEERGFAWAYWEFGAGFGIYDRGAADWRPGLVGALIPDAFAGFVDDDGSVFESDIEWLGAAGITRGCNPPVNDRFCPDELVTRGQMAAFLVRSLDLAGAAGNPFVDDTGSVFVDDIARLAAAGITRGCNPPVNDRFCPDEPVTRGQMAAFLTRALNLPVASADVFVDDSGSVFVDDIARLAAAGITRGCNPPVNDRFCPNAAVTRGEMAAFLHRAGTSG